MYSPKRSLAVYHFDESAKCDVREGSVATCLHDWSAQGGQDGRVESSNAAGDDRVRGGTFYGVRDGARDKPTGEDAAADGRDRSAERAASGAAAARAKGRLRN